MLPKADSSCFVFFSLLFALARTDPAKTGNLTPNAHAGFFSRALASTCTERGEPNCGSAVCMRSEASSSSGEQRTGGSPRAAAGVCRAGRALRGSLDRGKG